MFWGNLGMGRKIYLYIFFLHFVLLWEWGGNFYNFLSFMRFDCLGVRGGIFIFLPLVYSFSLCILWCGEEVLFKNLFSFGCGDRRLTTCRLLPRDVSFYFLLSFNWEILADGNFDRAKSVVVFIASSSLGRGYKFSSYYVLLL